jgi:hypothetical protein
MIKMGLRETGWEDVDLIYGAQEGSCGDDNELSGSNISMEFFDWVVIGFSRRILFCVVT